MPSEIIVRNVRSDRRRLSMNHAVITGVFDIAQFLIPALIIAWADRIRAPRQMR